MREYFVKLKAIFDNAIQNDMVTHEFFTYFCRTYYYIGCRNDDVLFIYETMTKSRTSIHKEDAQGQFIREATKTNEPVYLEFAEHFSKLLEKKLENAPKVGAYGDYPKNRERLARKYSHLKPPENTMKLSTKNSKEYSRITKWKSGAIDDLSTVLAELAEYDVDK